MKLFWLVLSQASALVKHDEKLEILADENFDQMRGFGNYAPCVTEIDTIFTNATLIVNTSKSNTSGRIELVNYQGLSLFSVSCCTKFYRYLNPVVQKTTISSKIDNMNCYIDVEANKSCTALFIRFEEVAVEECSLCECDKIQLKWGGKSSDPICGCAGIILKL